MTTWTFKGPLVAFGLLTLVACEAGQGFGPRATGSRAAGETAAPVSRARMADGVVLMAPSGFCIDRSSLEPRFAVMARCDGLGVPSAAGGAPLGLITVSLTNAQTGPLPSAKQIAGAAALQKLSNVQQSDDQVVFRAQGRVPIEGLSAFQWRAIVRIGSQIAGIAVYGPQNGQVVTATGRAVLLQLVERSIAATPEPKTLVTTRR